MSSQIIRRFEEIAAKYPQKNAVCYDGTSITFSELKEQAAALGSILAEKNEAGGPVGVFVNRGLCTAIFFLAVIYSGTFYVPLDPELPREKRNSILEDAEISLLLGEPCNAQLAAENGQLLFVDGTAAGEYGGQYSYATKDEKDPLYMVYTSGSTGKPKGVLKGHGSVPDFIDAFYDAFSFSEEDIIGNQTPFFFDASAKDYYLMLLKGLTLEIISSELFMFPIKLVELLNDRRITYICWVPTALSLVAQLGTFDKILPTTLQKVFFVGEVFPIKQLKKWMQTLPEITYVNLFGSSEIAGICLYYQIPQHPDEKYLSELSTLPMGKALANCSVYLMGEEGHIVPPEDTEHIGEVCVESAALALEYFHDPEKTEKVFQRKQDETGRRVLYTGDLARYDAEGNLIFISRKDFQIKHMGRRIELGEIESVVDKLEEVVRCCCLYNDVKKRIHLFVQLQNGSDWDGKTVQTLLAGKLSDYMIPNRVTVVDEMPFNANGKINRSALKELL